jgi:hypothetical protein
MYSDSLCCNDAFEFEMISLFKQFYAFIAGKALVEANNITLWKVTFKELPTLYPWHFKCEETAV